ncbi:MAG: hypothetical protein NTW69_01475 [Chloroflexi bacterium]|nr:hypothetical protein [Chloroflexota bacterium]
MDVALEALREGLRGKKCTPDQILRFAHVDRVERIIFPYLEALVLTNPSRIYPRPFTKDC